MSGALRGCCANVVIARLVIVALFGVGATADFVRPLLMFLRKLLEHV